MAGTLHFGRVLLKTKLRGKVLPSTEIRGWCHVNTFDPTWWPVPTQWSFKPIFRQNQKRNFILTAVAPYSPAPSHLLSNAAHLAFVSSMSLRRPLIAKVSWKNRNFSSIFVSSGTRTAHRFGDRSSESDTVFPWFAGASWYPLCGRISWDSLFRVTGNQTWTEQNYPFLEVPQKSYHCPFFPFRTNLTVNHVSKKLRSKQLKINLIILVLEDN